MKPTAKMWIAVVLFILLPFIGGIAGSFLTRKNIKNWYEHLEKPSWRPPNWAFGPAWTILYAAMGYG